MPRPPLVGVTTSAAAGAGPARAVLNAAYLRALQQAGGVPVLLPPYLERPALEALWPRLDALLLTGGGDVDPARFGEPPHPTVDGVCPSRDALELELVERALAAGRPVLAICRGLQVLNVALGGTLWQDIRDQLGSAVEHHQAAPRSTPSHPVKVQEHARLGEILAAPELPVNSFHHQAVKRLGRGLQDVAWAPDGVIEGVELPEAGRFVVGVQWHPEDLVDRDQAARRLFRALVAAAGA